MADEARDETLEEAREVLGLGEADLDLDDVNRAYAERKALYQEGSLATYALLGEEERAEVLHRIEAAHRRLVDHLTRPTGRAAEGASPEAGGDAPIPGGDAKGEASVARIEDHRPEAGATSEDDPPGDAPPSEAPAGVAPPDAPAPDPYEPGSPPGAYLRARREALGLDLGAVAHRLRISRHYLECIEAEALAPVPAEVYLRGFVTNYCRALAIGEAEPLLAALLERYRGHADPDA